MVARSASMTIGSRLARTTAILLLEPDPGVVSVRGTKRDDRRDYPIFGAEAPKALYHPGTLLQCQARDVGVEDIERHSPSCCLASSRSRSRSAAISSKCSRNASSSPANISKAFSRASQSKA